MSRRRDPREEELGREEGWVNGKWVEFILTKAGQSFTITILVDGGFHGCYEQDTDHCDLLEMMAAEEEIVKDFGDLVTRLHQRKAS